jgi:hypothetical protein
VGGSSSRDRRAAQSRRGWDGAVAVDAITRVSSPQIARRSGHWPIGVSKGQRVREYRYDDRITVQAHIQRRTNNAAKTREKLREMLDLLRVYQDFVCPHMSLKYSGTGRIPGEIAGVVTRWLSYRDIFITFGPIARVPWIKEQRSERNGERSGHGPAATVNETAP